MLHNLHTVKVKFKDPQYNYITNVSSQTTARAAENYFVGNHFNVASFPGENFQRCMAIDFIENKVVNLQKEYANG